MPVDLSCFGEPWSTVEDAEKQFDGNSQTSSVSLISSETSLEQDSVVKDESDEEEYLNFGTGSRQSSGGESVNMALMRFCDYHGLEKNGWGQGFEI